MKCGLICARRARSSASIVRVRSRPSSASSAWWRPSARPPRPPSPARRRPAVRMPRWRPRTRSSATTGAITAVLTGQSGSGHATASGPSTMVRPVARTSSASRRACSRWCSAAPSQASRATGSQIAIAGQPSRARRCLDGARRALRGQAVLEVAGREGCRVQRRVGGVVDVGDEAARPATALPEQSQQSEDQQERAGDDDRGGEVEAARHRSNSRLLPVSDVLTSLNALATLPGVPEQTTAAREACTRLRWHEALRRRIPEAAAESRVRGAQASAALEGANLPVDVVRDLMRGARSWPEQLDPVEQVAKAWCSPPPRPSTSAPWCSRRRCRRWPGCTRRPLRP